MARANNGVDAEKAFEAYWNRVGHIERFPDKKDLMGLNKGKRLADFPKPSDYLVSSKDHPLHYAEVKSTVHKTRFAFGKIQPKQSAVALKSVLRGDSNYVFYIFSYHLGRWFTMPATQYSRILDTDARSVPFTELNEWTMQ